MLGPIYHIHLLLKLAAITTGLVRKGPLLRLNEIQGDPQASPKVKEEETEAHRGQVTCPKSQGQEEVDLRSETPSDATTPTHALSCTAWKQSCPPSIGWTALPERARLS